MVCILLVDDDATVRDVVAQYLRGAGLDVVEAEDGPQAVALERAHRPDLVVLDLMLPGMDGFEVFGAIRAHREQVPVLMLTARGDEEDRIQGLRLGADDYVAKPFSARELVLRVQALLRRTADGPVGVDGVLVDGPLRVDGTARTVRLGDRPLALRLREFELLTHFLTRPGRVWSRAELMREVWGWDFGDESTITVHVRRLREKVEDDPAHPRRLVTVWGAGYRWDRDGT